MKQNAAERDVAEVARVAAEMNFQTHVVVGARRTVICLTGNASEIDSSVFETLPGVAETIRVTKPYKLVTREVRPENTIVRMGDSEIGGDELAIIAGPCAIESREQTFAVAEAVSRAGARFFRGGAFKPRTSPYSFQGLEEEGLKILAEARETFGLKIITEAIDERSLEMVERYADCIQIGARNMQNFSLLRRAGRSRLPVLLKRGFAATLDEWLLAAEYILAEGNYNVILCERGVRTFAGHARYTLDLSVVPAIERISHLPIVVDPSHGTGKNHLVAPMARAAVAAGAQGLMIEVHNAPKHAQSDGAQALTIQQFEAMLADVRAIHSAISPAPVG